MQQAFQALYFSTQALPEMPVLLKHPLLLVFYTTPLKMDPSSIRDLRVLLSLAHLECRPDYTAKFFGVKGSTHLLTFKKLNFNRAHLRTLCTRSLELYFIQQRDMENNKLQKPSHKIWGTLSRHQHHCAVVAISQLYVMIIQCWCHHF